MAKNKPGLPDGFEINLDAPAQLGDYLDEDAFAGNAARVIAAKRPAVPVAPTAPPAPKPEPVVTIAPAPRPQVVEQQSSPVFQEIRTEPMLELADARKRNLAKTSSIRRPERMQFNMRPETVKMFNNIVEFVQRYSLQNDAKASEIFDALVSVLYDAKEELAFNDVPRRGKWGTPTARAFPTALGNAFARAIAARFAKHGRE
jgi:hypothetical protein